MASNPENRAYRIVYALAHAPGTKLETSTNLVGSVLPAQIGIGFPNVGFSDAWRPGWTCPVWAQPSMAGKTAAAAMRMQIGNSDDTTYIDTHNSQVGAPFITGYVAGGGILNQGTQVVLGIGSHDEFVPYGTQMEYLFKLRSPGVPVEAHVVVRGGHTAMPDFGLRARNAVLSYAKPWQYPASSRLAVTGANSIQYYRVDRASGAVQAIGNSATMLRPFTVEVPRVMYGGTVFTMLVTGEPNTLYTITTNVGAVTNQVLPSTGWAVHEAMTGGPGTISYSGTFTPPGQSAVALDVFSCRRCQPSSRPRWALPLLLLRACTCGTRTSDHTAQARCFLSSAHTPTFRRLHVGVRQVRRSRVGT